MHDLTKQIEEVENQIEFENSQIASMEQQLADYIGEPNKWYSSCEYNLNKAELKRDHLERKLKKLLTSQKELAMQEKAALLKQEKQKAAFERQIALAEATSKTKSAAKESKHLKIIELEQRRFVEFRKLIQPLLGDETTFTLVAQSEKIAQEWINSRTKK